MSDFLPPQNFYHNKYVPEAVRQWTALAEQSLASNFEDWVGRLGLAELISRTQKPPKKLGRYALVPIITSVLGARTQSFEGAGYDYQVPRGIVVEKSLSHESLFLDTAFAIGLAYDGVLRAVSGTYISPEFHRLVNIQNQGLVESKPELGRDNPALRLGLHGGFHWEDPLLQGWTTIGERLEAEQIVIVGANNNPWALVVGAKGKELPEGHPDPRWEEIRLAGVAQLKPHYDHVADRLDFSPQPDDNWILDLPTGQA